MSYWVEKRPVNDGVHELNKMFSSNSGSSNTAK